ncbi:MAG: aspartate kinase [Planctomycetes bacterium]|jgi:aspartate kinase|nr:aspartate kinase [Planctomycetota bacterium]
MTTKVCKFGGTSLADAAQVQKVQSIVEAEPARRYVVASAPGKRTAEDQKVTDLLYLCHEHAKQGLGFDEVFGLIATRFREMARALAVGGEIDAALAEVREGIAAHARTDAGPDFAASRGEYLNSRLLAERLGVPFVDAAEIIFFNGRGRLDEAKTYAAIGDRLGGLERAVVPGFYGSTPGGDIKTFSRGGSDVTGAIVARGVHAAVYENWTDVSGLLMTDPRIVSNPRKIETITYRELRELSYSGATVLHEEAVFPVREAGIPVNIRNSNAPDEPGTMIVRGDVTDLPRSGSITGIAGRKDFTVINIDKALMNAELGFGRRVLHVLEDSGISFEHMPSGIDTLGVVVSDAALAGKLEEVLEKLRVEVEPDHIEIDRDLALIATVGRGMAHTPGMAAKLFGSLGAAGINIRMIDQGSSELNIIVGVDAHDYEDAVRAIYAAFVG